MDFSISHFTFRDVITKQTLKFTDADYGLYIWPCAPVLAHYVWLNRNQIKGKSIIEIGAGTSLPGIVAAKCGAEVILSDRSSSEKCLAVCRQNLELNNLTHASIVGITWGQVTPAIVSLPKLDFILASDCFYDTKDFEVVVMTMSFLLHKNPDAEVWCCYQERSSERTIEHLLNKWELQGEQVEIPNMEIVESSFDGHSRHVIQLFIIKLRR